MQLKEDSKKKKDNLFGLLNIFVKMIKDPFITIQSSGISLNK